MVQTRSSKKRKRYYLRGTAPSPPRKKTKAKAKKPPTRSPRTPVADPVDQDTTTTDNNDSDNGSSLTENNQTDTIESVVPSTSTNPTNLPPTPPTTVVTTTIEPPHALLLKPKTKKKQVRFADPLERFPTPARGSTPYRYTMTKLLFFFRRHQLLLLLQACSTADDSNNNKKKNNIQHLVVELENTRLRALHLWSMVHDGRAGDARWAVDYDWEGGAYLRSFEGEFGRVGWV